MKKRDIQIIMVLLFVAIVALVTVRVVGQNDSADSYVNINVGENEYKKVLLSEPQTVIINIDGKYNEIKIDANGVLMHDSNCENKDCLHQGEITLENISTRIMGGWIICLPNHVSIELVKGRDE
ncbi:NusG domain II-containing protein [Alkaliphilus peptidifermentans]|uniref:Uncharacterized protein n=1 Tax=Alkaliphilus peptidifermentans DSM 18978 TaxID=1120976 RepID=A0A1G5J129_9FIRM|nr:NusG domain II-containing protein [Alkaliphilus peptidifermentans]SCY82073.1 hypothetical protein SAMN03080606_02609 [Alkaliphilus peptidifermentans DSM 18978]